METGFEDRHQFPNGLECDHWDEQSVHFLVRARATGEWIAAMRLILPQQGQLPVEQLCQLDAGALPLAMPWQFGEISRLCIVDNARRRSHSVDALKGIADRTHSPDAHREPEIMLGLLRAAASFSRIHDIKYWYFMTTAGIARMAGRVNILLKPIGPAVQHRGDRYPFLADLNESELLVRGKSAEFAAMFAKQTAYRLFSEACGSAMTLSNLPESLPMPGPQRAVA